MADVGLVVVSHSRPLARAAVVLAGQMLPDRPVRVAVAAGLDEETLGTDAVAIRDAIVEVDSPQGVVVLMDLGSAVLSAELALELLADPDARDRVLLSPAPLVEGLVAACVAAAGGADRAAVAAEAAQALAGKTDHLGAPAAGSPALSPSAEAAEAGDAGEAAVRVTVANEHGLHARPAARLVTEASGFDARVLVRNVSAGTAPVPATSLSRVGALGVLAGHEIELSATGREARAALDHLVALAERRFDEPPTPAPRAAPAAATSPGAPLPASPGVVVGPVRRLVSGEVTAGDEPPGDPEQERQRLADAVGQVRRTVQDQRRRAAREVGAEEAAIFDAHAALLADPDLLADVRQRIGPDRGAVRAWSGVLAEVERRWADQPDDYLLARAADVRAVADDVLRVLTGAPPPRPSGPGVLVAADLTPGQVADLDLGTVTGLVLAAGSPTSHAAIVARARGLPAVVAAGEQVLGLTEGTVVAVDGGTGELHVEPSAELRMAYQQRAVDQAVRQARARTAAAGPAVTADGVTVPVLANVGSAVEATEALAAGADGAGLVRTEFLLGSLVAAPSVEEQQALYSAVLDGLGGRRVVVRTLDVGGDKPLPFLPVPAEANPFLGLRGLRLSLAHQDLLRDQLTALCRVARQAPLDLMFPMVTTRDELRRARAVLADAAEPEGVPPGLRVGMMVEVPAAALRMATFLADLDFVSIGTNDLVQYTVAAERGNASVAHLADALDPAVLQLVDLVCRAAGDRVPVSVCGDAAADPLAVPVLLGLGVTSLSVPGPQVPVVKERVRGLDRSACRDLAVRALALAGAHEVRALVGEAFPVTS